MAGRGGAWRGVAGWGVEVGVGGHYRLLQRLCGEAVSLRAAMRRARLVAVAPWHLHRKQGNTRRLTQNLRRSAGKVHSVRSGAARRRLESRQSEAVGWVAFYPVESP